MPRLTMPSLPKSLLILCVFCVSVVSLAVADDEPEDPVRRDFEELIRHGGRFPAGFVPAGVRGPSAEGRAGKTSLAHVSGAILKRYLEVKGDPAKAAVYEQALAVVAEALLDPRPAPDARALGFALMPTIVRGLQDEQTAPACIELMAFVAAEAGASAPQRPVQVGGAHRLGGARLVDGRIVDVPAGSVAAHIGLQPGDEILSVDGEKADSARFRAVQRVVETGGKLTLRVLRRTGETVTLEIEFERE